MLFCFFYSRAMASLFSCVQERKTIVSWLLVSSYVLFHRLYSSSDQGSYVFHSAYFDQLKKMVWRM